MATGTIQKNMVLLWTNPNPTSAFAAQTIQVDTSYDMYLIVCTSHVNSATIKVDVVLTDDGCCILYPTGANGTVSGSMTFFKREITKASNGISIGACYAVTATASWYAYTAETGCIPYKIFGIKI